MLTDVQTPFLGTPLVPLRIRGSIGFPAPVRVAAQQLGCRSARSLGVPRVRAPSPDLPRRLRHQTGAPRAPRPRRRRGRRCGALSAALFPADPNLRLPAAFAREELQPASECYSMMPVSVKKKLLRKIVTLENISLQSAKSGAVEQFLPLDCTAEIHLAGVFFHRHR